MKNLTFIRLYLYYIENKVEILLIIREKIALFMRTNFYLHL